MVVVPVAYVLVDGLARRTARLRTRFAARSEQRTAAPGA
jgi:hypothetical protein